MAAKHVSSKRLHIKSDLSKSLASLLECPVCFDFMVPPITQCLNGHNICSSCKPRLNLCPTCRLPLTITSRNVALENIAETLVDDGSREPSKATSPQQRMYECLAGKGKGCKWKGRRSDLWAHVQHNHEGQAVHCRKETQQFRVSNHDFNASGSSTQLISIFDQLFWYQFRQDLKNAKWCQAIQYIGARRQASKYKYTFEFGPLAEDSLKRSIVYSSVTHSDEEDIEYIFKSSRCFCTDLNSIKHFVAIDNSIKFKVKMERI